MPAVVCNFIVNPGAGGKFVVLTKKGGDDGVIIFSDFTRDFMHRDIVDRWKRERGGGHGADGLVVSGGGWWRFENEGLLVLYGRSAAYGRFDPEWVRNMLRPGMVMRETRIDVR